MQIGRKIYYDKATGNVYVTTSEMSGDVIETTQDQDFTTYKALHGIDPTTVGLLQVDFGQFSDNFSKYLFHVDPSTQQIVWNTAPQPTLDAAKSAKLAQLEDLFNQSLLNGFTSTADGTSRVYPIDPISMSKLTSAHAVVNGGKVGVITIKDFNDNRVSLTADEYKQMAADGFNFYNSKEQHLWDLQDRVKAATTQDQLAAIVW